MTEIQTHHAKKRRLNPTSDFLNSTSLRNIEDFKIANLPEENEIIHISDNRSLDLIHSFLPSIKRPSSNNVSTSSDSIIAASSSIIINPTALQGYRGTGLFENESHEEPPIVQRRRRRTTTTNSYIVNEQIRRSQRTRLPPLSQIAYLSRIPFNQSTPISNRVVGTLWNPFQMLHENIEELSLEEFTATFAAPPYTLAEEQCPATEQEILALKTYPLTNDSQDCCCICLDQMCKSHLVRQLNCVHAFHVDCIDKWLKVNKVCPVCKKQI